MRRGAPAMPDATEKSWIKNPEKHPFDFIVTRLLVILTRPCRLGSRDDKKNKDATSGDYSFKMFG